MIRSLRTRLLVGIGASFVIVLVASGVVLYSLIRTALVSDFDESLCAEVRTLAALVENEHGWVHSEMADLEMPQFARDKRPQYHQLWLDGGKVIVTSPGGKSPRGVSYATRGVDFQAALYNQALLPASPFIYYDRKLVTSETWP